MLEGLTLLLAVIKANPVFEAGSAPVVLAKRAMSMENRYNNPFVNGVFKDNILLTMSYMSGSVESKEDIDWDKVNSPFNYKFSLNPGETFAFHDQIKPEYEKSIVKTTNAHFNYTDGFKSDGYLVGDGVCHLASIIYWTAKDAGLTAIAPVNHDFAVIPEIPREYGVSIYSTSTQQNLYITNSFDKPVDFVFNFDGTILTVEIASS